MRSLFVVSSSVALGPRARAPKKSRENTFARRARRPRTSNVRQTKTVPNGQRLYFTEHNTRLSWKGRAAHFSWTQITTHSTVFWEVTFFTNGQQQNTRTYHDFSRIHEYPRQGISKEHCKNALLLLYRAKYTNIAEFSGKHLFHQQPAKNIRSLNTKRIPKLFHWSSAQERTRGESSLWPRGSVPELPSGTKGSKAPIWPTLLTT